MVRRGVNGVIIISKLKEIVFSFLIMKLSKQLRKPCWVDSKLYYPKVEKPEQE